MAKLQGAAAAFFMLGETNGTAPEGQPSRQVVKSSGNESVLSAASTPTREIACWSCSRKTPWSLPDEHRADRRRRERLTLQEGQDPALSAIVKRLPREPSNGRRIRTSAICGDSVPARRSDYLQPARCMSGRGRGDEYRQLVSATPRPRESPPQVGRASIPASSTPSKTKN